MPRNLRKDKYQLVVFVGDISTKEGNVVFELLKHLGAQQTQALHARDLVQFNVG